MLKAHRKSNVDEEDDVPLHRATNEEEAKVYSTKLDDIIFQMGVSVKDEKVDAIKDAMKMYKDIISNMFPNMAAANTEAVFASVKDKVGLCICPRTEQKERLLENIISAKEVTLAAEVLGKVEEITPDERDLIKELFDSLEVAHSHLAIACSILSRLSSTMRPADLRMILDASIRPLIEIKMTMAWKLRETPEEKEELPDDHEERVELLLLPTPMARTLRDEKINSPTRLLVAAWVYRVSNVFGKGSTQRKIQELYSVRAKQLAVCIMGRKYLGGVERKRRLSRADDGPPHRRKLRHHLPRPSKKGFSSYS